MRIVGHRQLRGASMYAQHPVWYLVARPLSDLAAYQERAEMTAESIGEILGELINRIQRRAGLDCHFQNSWQDDDGDWIVVHDYAHEHAGEAAGRAAVAVLAGQLTLDEAVASVTAAIAAHAPEPSLNALLAAAAERNIPVLRRGDQQYQLGWGSKQKHLSGTLTSEASGLGFDIANDHERILKFLEDTGIPIPEGEARRTLAGCIELAEELRYPLTVKPLRGRGGVTICVDNDEELEVAYDKAKELHPWVVLEDFISGEAYEALVVGGNLIGVARKGDGGDVTDMTHPSVQVACERAAKLVGLDVVSVDIVGRSIHESLETSRSTVVSMNPQPNLEPFLEMGAADAVLDTLLDDDGRIPLVAVTGTNGKTTTIRLISHILKYAGARVGMACTGAVEVENHVVLKGDYSGPMAAKAVIQEPTVTHAVCEVARGGILRRGLGFDQSDVSVFLNVGSDHLGQGGINTLEDLAKLKGVVVKAAKDTGAVVLNADDTLVWAMRKEVKCKVIAFSMDANSSEVKAHLRSGRGNSAVVYQDGAIVLRRGAARFRVIDAVDVPITLGGHAPFNIQNAMAATGVAYALGVSEQDCRAGLLTFNPSTNQLPGRMNLMTLGGVKVLIDYGHNVPALKALGEVLPRLATGRKINVADASGNRRDEDLRAFGATIGGMYDRIYICDPDPRGRKAGETSAVVREGLLASGFDESQLTMEPSEDKAFRAALAESRPGDLVVLQADDIEGAITLCKTLKARLEAGESPHQVNQELAQ
jgi:UDP-N-acetylmuramyl tripeptide synthase